MGLLDDIFNIVNEADELKKDVMKEFSDLGSEIKESVDDISYGAKQLHQDARNHVKKKLSVDGFTKPSGDSKSQSDSRKDT